MVKCVKAPVTQADDVVASDHLNLIPGSHMVERNNQIL